MAAGYGRIGGAHAVVLVQDFEFMGGSLGMAAGEAFIAAAEAAVRRKAAMIMVTVVRRRAHAGRHPLADADAAHDAGDPNAARSGPALSSSCWPIRPRAASPRRYAMLGDVHIAEPGALIGFAGPRVIEQTIRQKLPEGFQRSEYLLDKGMVDMVVDRRQLKATVCDAALRADAQARGQRRAMRARRSSFAEIARRRRRNRSASRVASASSSADARKAAE